MDPVRWVLGLPVLLQPVVERKRSRERSNLFANQLLLLGQLEVHGRDCSPTTSAALGAGGGAGGDATGSVTHSPESQLFELRTGRGGPTMPVASPPAPPPAPATPLVGLAFNSRSTAARSAASA